MDLEIGEKVEKFGGDYTMKGTVVGAFFKLDGTVRYVVEADYPAGLLMIYKREQLRLMDE